MFHVQEWLVCVLYAAVSPGADAMFSFIWGFALLEMMVRLGIWAARTNQRAMHSKYSGTL